MKYCRYAAAAAVFFLSASFSVPALEEEIPPLPPDIIRIREAGELRVAQFGGTRPGFFFFVEGERLEAARAAGVAVHEHEGKYLAGHDVEMALSLAEEIGVDLRIIRTYPHFSATVAAVAAGEADIAMTKLSKTLARAVSAELSRPYFAADITIILNRVGEERLARSGSDFGAGGDTVSDTDAAAVLSRLAAGGGVLGVIPATSQKEWTSLVFPGAAVREYVDQDALFGAVHSGEVTAVLYEEFEAKRFFRLWPGMALNCRMVKHPHLTDLMVFATRPGDEGMKRLVDAWLDRQPAPSAEAILDRFIAMMQRDDSKRPGRPDAGAKDSGAAAGAAAGIAILLLTAWVLSARPPKKLPEQEKPAS